MMWRFIGFLISTALAYALLRGWPEAMPPVVRACVAVLVLVAGIGLWVRQVWRGLPAARVRRGVGMMDYVAVVVAVLAMESGFLWFLTAAPDPLADAAVEVRAWLRSGDEEERRTSGLRQGNWLWDNETRRPLPKRTNFKPGNRPEVFVRLRDGGDAAELLARQVYVGAFALGRYRQAAWQAFPGPPGGRLLANEAGFVELGERPGRAIVHEVFHGGQDAGQNSLIGLQGVVMVRVPELLRLDSGLHLLPPVSGAAGFDYLVSSKPMRLEDLPAGMGTAPWPDPPDALLDLPERRDLADRIRELAVVAAGEGPLVDRLLGLQNHLRTTLRYSLETTNERDLDPLENFLFYEQRGHCELFATAGALLARAIGVPARVAYGWAGGTYFESSRLFVFRAREAHAWTEVWLDGVGWVVMDPTPPSAIGGELAEVAPPGALPPGADGIEDFSDDESAEGEAAGAGAIGRVLTLVFGVPAVLLGLWRGMRARRRAGVAGPRGPEDGRTPDYLRAWRRACAGRGVPIPPGMPLRRHARALNDSGRLAERLVGYHYRVRYEGDPADARVERALVAEIRRWEREG
jgi:hypothetical protein